MPAGLRAKDFVVVINQKELLVQIKQGDVLASGQLHGTIRCDDSTWTLDRNTATLQVQLEKTSTSGGSWWPSVLVGEPQLDTSKIEPENSKLSDLDGETRAMVEKMMVD